MNNNDFYPPPQDPTFFMGRLIYCEAREADGKPDYIVYDGIRKHHFNTMTDAEKWCTQQALDISEEVTTGLRVQLGRLQRCSRTIEQYAVRTPPHIRLALDRISANIMVIGDALDTYINQLTTREPQHH